MLEFRNIQLSDKEWIDESLKMSDFKGCEYSFANNIAWRRLGNAKISRFEDFYICASFLEETPAFFFPAGKGDYRKLFHEFYEFSSSMDKPLIIQSVSRENIEMFRELYGDCFEVESDEGGYDYIYNADDLINLSGKKYHSKRNHLARFNENNWGYEEISDKNMDECIELSVNLYNDKMGYTNRSSVLEQLAIHTFFDNFDYLGLKGGVIRINNKVVAFCIGEKINSDTMCIHIEKALPDIQGAYTAINNEFAKREAKDCRYINREEDLGIEGLRKAKKSYHPCFLLEKHKITFNKEAKL